MRRVTRCARGRHRIPAGLGSVQAGHPPVVTESNAGRHAGARALRLRHRALPGELRAIRRHVERWAEEAGLPDDMVVDLQLALGEAVANGVEHAYLDETAGNVGVAIELGAGAEPTVTVRVTDEGRWRAVPDSPGHRGRGLLMIDRLATRVRVLCTPRGTEVCFEIPFTG